MNYFELFEIPISLKINKALIQKKYYALSKQFHPDNYTQASKLEQDASLKKASYINEAYNVLQHKQKLIHYILKEQHQISENEKNELPQAFLMEMMDINEQLMEYESCTDEQKENIKQELISLKQLIEKEIAEYSTHDILELNTTVLHTLKNYYLKMKYVQRIEERF